MLGRRGALMLGGSALLAAGGAKAQMPTKPTGQVIVGLSQEPTVFNPLMPAIEVDQGVWWNLFNPLWGVDPAGNFTPAVGCRGSVAGKRRDLPGRADLEDQAAQ